MIHDTDQHPCRHSQSSEDTAVLGTDAGKANTIGAYSCIAL